MITYKLNSMEPHPCMKHFFDNEIIENLTSQGINKRKAEDQLFTKYSYLIQIGINKYFISDEDSFDAYADTVLAAIQAVTNGCFEGRATFKTFFYEIYHNKCVDLLRKKGALKNSVHATVSITGMENYLSENSKSIIENLMNKSDFDKVKQKMNELCENCQRLLLLSADGYSDREIAGIMNFKTANVVKTSRLRCLKKLRQLINFREKSMYLAE